MKLGITILVLRNFSLEVQYLQLIQNGTKELPRLPELCAAHVYKQFPQFLEDQSVHASCVIGCSLTAIELRIPAALSNRGTIVPNQRRLSCRGRSV